MALSRARRGLRMKNFLRSTLCMATVLGSGCASDMTELGDSTLEVKTETKDTSYEPIH